MQNQDVEISKQNAFVIYESDGDLEMYFRVNEKTEVEQTMRPEIYKFPFNQKIKVYSFPIPDRNFLKEKNQVLYELAYNPLVVTTHNYFSAKYSFQLKDQFSYYFMIGLKFMKNDKHSVYKEPPGRSIDDEIVELYYFFLYLCNQYVDKMERISGESTENLVKVQNTLEVALKELTDLVEIFKMINRGTLTSFPRATISYFRLLDDFILSLTEHEEYPDLQLFCLAMVGMFQYDHFISRDYSLKNSSILLNYITKLPSEKFLIFNEMFPVLRQQLLNGSYVLMNFSIKDGSGTWLNMINSPFYQSFLDEQSFYLRINEFIRRSGSCMNNKESFDKAKQFLIKNYQEREKELKNPQQSFNAVLKNIAILSVNKENLLDTLVELYEADLLDTDKLRNIKEEIRRKKWEDEEEENFAEYVMKLKAIIDKLEKKISEAEMKEVEEKAKASAGNEDENKSGNAGNAGVNAANYPSNLNNTHNANPAQINSLTYNPGYSQGYYGGSFGGAINITNNNRSVTGFQPVRQSYSYSTQLLYNEFKNLLYDLSSSIKYIFTLIKLFNYENLEIYMVKRAINSVYDFSLDDYSFIILELQNIPPEVKKEIIDSTFFERIKYSLKKVTLPFEPDSKEVLAILLLNKDLFTSTNGSLEFIKEFIRNKPNFEDLMFIVKDLILPQKTTVDPEAFREMFIYVKNYLMSNINEIYDLITTFSALISILDAETEKETKLVICEDFWKTINQRYSPEVFLGLSQIFNEKDEGVIKDNKESNKESSKDSKESSKDNKESSKENKNNKDSKDNNLSNNLTVTNSTTKLDIAIEISYIQYVKSIIESINTDIQNFEKINQFFNSLCISVYTNDYSDQKEKVIFSNNASTEKIINSILDILTKASDPEKLSKTFLLENPSKENFWYRIVKSRGKYTSFLNHQYVIAIVNNIISIYEGFTKGNLPVSDYITISKHSNTARDALVSYFQVVVRNTTYKELQNEIEKYMKNLNDNLNTITEVENFFNHYGSKIDRTEEITQFIKKTKVNFKQTAYRDFVLPEDILEMKDNIQNVNHWSETVIFQNVMDFHLFESLQKEKVENLLSNIEPLFYDDQQHSSDFIGDFERDLTNPEDVGPVYKSKVNKLSMAEVFDLAGASVKEIQTVLNSMITTNDFSELSLANTMKYFKGLGKGNAKEHYINESELISKLLKFNNHQKNNLQSILKTFCEIAIFIKFCSIMIKLDSVYLFSVNNISIYKEFMDLMNNPNNSFDKIFSASLKITDIKDKYLNKFDVENLFFELAENKELVDFLINTPDEDIRNMVDAVDEHGDSFIRVQTIRDLLIIGSFVRSIKLKEYTSNRENNPVEEEFASRIITAISENNSFQNIDALINSCGKQFLGIKHLHNELSNREEASKIKAKEICKDSYFDFNFNFYKKTYEVNVCYGKSLKKITFRDLCDLRDRVLLLLYNEKERIFDEEIEDINKTGMEVISTGNKPDNIQYILSAFIKVVDISEKLIFILNDIYNNGYPINITKQIKLKDGEAYPFQMMLEDISGINTQWNDDLKEAYTQFYPLTYYNGNQFWQLEHIFTDTKKTQEKSYGYYLLKYADPEVDITNLVSSNKYALDNETQTSPKGRILKLGEALSKVIDPRRNGAKAINFKKLNKVILNLKGSHFIFSNPSTLRIYHHLLSVHFSIEGALPAANQIFYCTKDTTFHEVISFLSRFVYCPVQRLFTIVRVENLSFELQNFLVDQVNKLMKQQKSSKITLLPYLCLISSDNSSFINTQFQENPYIYQLRDFDVLDESAISKILKSLDLNATTIRSDDTGAGKTFYIKRQADLAKDLTGATYINFPLVDSVNLEKISERLYELNQYTSKKFIHITICGIIDDFEMLDYLLFEFIIVGCLKNDIFVSFRNKDEPIYIEISNTFNDYLYNAISILPLFPHEEMLISKDILGNIDMGKYPFDPIQVVCNYLFLYEQNLLSTQDVDPRRSLNCRMFTRDECLTLLSKYFTKNHMDVTFRQIQIFVSILADQLLKFSENFYFTCENIKFIQNNNIADVRSHIMSSLLLMTEEFTTRSIKSARDSQNLTSLKLKRSVTRENLNSEDARIEEINSLSNVMSWSQSNHLLIMFHEDGYCMTPVYREKNEVPSSVKQLVESQKAILGDYQRMTHKELLTKLISIVGGEYLEEMFIDSNYVMTADNFLKMLLIIIRARCNVPIVIMGETGCGKTSLVKFLATRILHEGFEVINFHAGIKESHIIERMNEIKLKAYDFIEGRIWVFLDEINTCDCMGLITEIITQNTVLGEPLPYNIVFIAACNPYKIRKDTGEVGLVKQRVATKLVYRVHPLPDSLIDYVWDYGSLTETEEKLYIGNILQNISGDLKNIAIDLVVKSQVFIRNCEDKYAVSLRDVNRFKILHEWFYKMIEEKNEKDNEGDKKKEEKGGYYSGYYSGYGASGYNNNYPGMGLSSYNYNYNPYSSYGGGYYYSSHIKYTGKTMMARKALILSLLLCYYNRISLNSDRSEYKKIITRFLSINERELEEMINEEQRDIVTRMELPPAIAINKALLENVFTLLVCVINKIPLFICGKPGCSKSLAVQLLVSNLRGQDSTDKFFKKLPRILAIPYQGSESSTSEGIEKIFEKANNVLKNADKTILPLIVFDEIGLAEISKNNPLKILHSLLEPENPVIAFVGISNWRLDASKMNRAVYLARPDPDLEDLESTALSIFEYYIKEPRFDEKNIMKALAQTYYEFKKEQHDQGYSDFHGTRDFYSLIKQVTKHFNEHYNNYNEVKYSIVKDALSRNFGGLSSSISSIHASFAKNLKLLSSDFAEIPQKPLMELVKENLRDKDSRFLLLFTNGESASYILDNYLKNDLKERQFIIGSEFEGDKDKEEHSFRLLSDIILYMESGSSIILKNLDQIYGSLYDLFNQNFMIVGQKKNCRIALGSTNNPMCFVHNNFHCVVLVDIRDLNRMDPPFLNRFEKQVLTFESVLTLRQRNIVHELNKWIKYLTTIYGNISNELDQDEGMKKQGMEVEIEPGNNTNSNLQNNLAISDMIITYNYEFCPSLALLHFHEEKSNEDIIEACKKDILSVSNISLIVFSVLSEMYQNSRDEIIKTHKVFFEEQNHDSLSQYISNTIYSQSISQSIILDSIQTSKLIVYTYSNILDEIKFQNLNIKSDIGYSVLNIAEIKTEKDFDHRFKMFLNNNESEWLFIKIDMVKEKNHIPMIKFKSDKYLTEYKRGVGVSHDIKINKNVVMIVYLSRTKSKQNNMVNMKLHLDEDKLANSNKNSVDVDNSRLESHFLSGWSQIMIDCINGGQIDNLKSLLDLSTIEVVKSNLDPKTISEMVFNIYLKFNYVPYNEKDTFMVKEYMSEMIRKIENDTELFEMIIKKCMDFLNDPKKTLPDWKIKICCDNKILSRSLNTFSAIKLLVADLIEEPLLKIIHFLESESALNSFFKVMKQGEDGVIVITSNSNSNILNANSNNKMLVDSAEEEVVTEFTNINSIKNDLDLALTNSITDITNNETACNAKRKIWRDIFEKKDLNQLYPYNVIQSLIINPIYNLKFPFSKSDIYELSLLIKESIDNIYVLDNAMYHGTSHSEEENKLLLQSEIENVKRLLKGSILHKILDGAIITSTEERLLQAAYVQDVLTYFITVEMKKQFAWRSSLLTIVEKFIGLDYDNLAEIFIFLWKNKKLFDSIFNILDILSNQGKDKEIAIIEEILKKDSLYEVNLTNTLINARKNAEITLFLNIYNEIGNILLIQLSNLETSFKKNITYALVLNTFITSLINFSLEIKDYPQILNLFIIINEYLKILSFIFENNTQEISKRVNKVFFFDSNSNNLKELSEFKFLNTMLDIIDEEAAKKKQSQSEEEYKNSMLIDIQIGLDNVESKAEPLDELKENIINSKLTIFENILIGQNVNNTIKAHIIHNIVKDVHLIRYSSMIFCRLFQDYPIDESFTSLLQPENNLRKIIDNAMEINKIDSYDHILFSFLSDFIRKFLHKDIESEKRNNNYTVYILRDYLDANFVNYQKYLELLRDNSSKFVNILGFAGLKHYLEIFGQYLTECVKMEKDPELIKNINQELELTVESMESTNTNNNHPPLIETLKNFILKSMMKKFRCNAQSLATVNFLDLGIKWINNKLFENNDNILGIELNLTELNSIYKEYSTLLTSLLNDDNEDNIILFKQMISKASINNTDKKAYDTRLLINQFFINKVYLSFSNVNFSKSLTYNHIVSIFEACTNEIREHLGDHIYNFIYNLVYNFRKKSNNNSNEESFFKITPHTEMNKLGTFGFIMQAYNLLLSSNGDYAKNFPYASVFKKIDNSNSISNNSLPFVEDLKHLESLYLPGGFVEFHDENLIVMMKHISENYETYGTQLGLYECSCGYLYTIGDCTRPYYTANCPNCKNVIGGASHVLSERAGHICLINADNKNEANRKETVLEHLREKLVNKPGYISKMADELSLQYSLRNLTPAGFRWFNLFNHSMIFMLIEMGIIQDSDFRSHLQNVKIKNYLAVDYLKSHINSDISKLGELLKVNDHYISLMHTLNGMHDQLTKNLIPACNFSTPDDRETFETLIQQRIITPHIEHIVEETRTYRLNHSLDKKLSYSKILDENFTDKEIVNYPLKDYLRIFRSTILGDWEDLKNEYHKFSSSVNNSNSNSNKNFQFLKILIEKFDEMILLSNLHPIIQFTNYMLNLCNYRLTRQEAKEKKIKDVITGNPVAEKMFLEFSKAWSRIAHRCTQFACKTLPVLEEITSEIPVSFVLIDDRELGYGMYMAAALQYLGQIQNEVLEAIVYLIRENTNYQIWGNMDIHKYSIQKISPHEIIMYQTNIDFVTNTTDHFSKFYEIYNGNFGQGSIVEYNFDKIEHELAFKLLTNKKILNYEDIVKIQYKFELLSINNKNSNLLNDIKSKVDQRVIIGEESNVIRKTLDKLEQQNVAYLHQIFSSLEIILCNLRYSNQVENCLLSTYIQKIQNSEKICFLLRETQPLCSVKLSNIISFYEIVEDKLFNHVVEFISPDYNTPLEERVKKSITEFFSTANNPSNRNKYPTYENMINVIQRFTIRCLVASIEPKFPVKEYLMRTDFWDMDVKEEIIDNFYNDFPDDILIANTLTLLEYIKESRKVKTDEQTKEKIDLNQDKNKIDQIRLQSAKKKNKFI